MHNVFKKKSAEKLHVQLSDGRIMLLEDLVMDYEKLLKKKSSKKKSSKKVISESKDDKAMTQELKVGEWFRIDREIIAKNGEEIRRKCNEAGTKGKELWERFEKSNNIADKKPNQYPRLIETYIFKHNWNYKTEQEMRDMCEDIGDGMCDEVICDLELQMRICNGKSVKDLVQKVDKLPRARVIKLRNGGTGFFGGGGSFNNPPAYLRKNDFNPNDEHCYNTTYAFRRVFSQNCEHCFVLLKPKQN